VIPSVVGAKGRLSTHGRAALHEPSRRRQIFSEPTDHHHGTPSFGPVIGRGHAASHGLI
jgi:hypothetical protein